MVHNISCDHIVLARNDYNISTSKALRMKATRIDPLFGVHRTRYRSIGTLGYADIHGDSGSPDRGTWANCVVFYEEPCQFYGRPCVWCFYVSILVSDLSWKLVQQNISVQY